MRVPFLHFDYQHQPLKSQFLEAFETFLDSNYYVLGKKVKEFEDAYAKFHNIDYCAGVASGLDALYLALRVLQIGKNDEVIVPSNTYIATVLAVSYVQAKPVFVEPELITYNIDPQKIEESITSRTKAILPVHLYGQAANMTSIMEIAKKYNLFVIEDNAQAHGALHRHQMTGTFGHINATSFYPSKNLGALGDAGAITTASQEWYEQIKMFRNYGSKVRYYNEVIGYNSRLDELQAALLLIKLQHLQEWNQERNRLAQRYIQNLQYVSEVHLPQTLDGNTHVYHLFVIRCFQRNELMEFLKKNGIDTLIHYPVPPHLQKAYQHLNFQKGDFPIAEKLADEMLSLPIYPGLSDSQIDFVCEKIQEFYKKS
jgi:dTDP-4-amino-4,6-dideoxygalactose transaminase